MLFLYAVSAWTFGNTKMASHTKGKIVFISNKTIKQTSENGTKKRNKKKK